MLGSSKRKEILEAPELLRIFGTGMELSKITKILMAGLLTLLFAMFISGTYQTITNRPTDEKSEFMILLIVLMIALTSFWAIVMYALFRNKKFELIFTQNGVVGDGFPPTKYEKFGGYQWITTSGFVATGQNSKGGRVTLYLTANSGLLPKGAFLTNYGTSILETYGYYFDNDQIERVEAIFSSYGVQNLTGN